MTGMRNVTRDEDQILRQALLMSSQHMYDITERKLCFVYCGDDRCNCSANVSIAVPHRGAPVITGDDYEESNSTPASRPPAEGS